MKSIVFVCLQKELVEDLETEKNLDFGDYNYELECLTSLNGIDATIKKINPDLVVLSYDALVKRDSWDFGDIPIAFHANDREELNDGAEYGFPTIGIASSSSELAEKLGNEPYMAAKKSRMQKEKPSDREDDDEENEVQLPKKHDIPRQQKKNRDINAHKKTLKDQIDDLEFLDDEEDEEEEEPARAAKNPAQKQNNGQRQKTAQKQNASKPKQQAQKPQQKPQKRQPAPVEDEEEEYEKEPSEPDEFEDLEDESFEEEESKPVKKKPISQKAMPKPKKKEKKEDYVQQEFKKDLIGDEDRKTEVITVYSAKGGVGKTTISTELAVYLSLVSIGRRKLRVCLVDYNIDFGDVRMTLNLSSKNLNLTNWAAEVQELLDSGRTAENIQYSREEMSDYFSVDKRSGLTVLQAPATNEDSMGINSETLNIILDNIIENGGFDYVICDTGNNTRDSTMIALEHADIILMIMTQNANTANCDKAFMSTMETINFDLSNAKLVINCIMPQKATKISVQEIVDYFPFECVGKLKFNTDVIKATNVGEPLAYQPDHEFTKQLRNIVTFILQQDDYEVDTKPKKKFLDFLHKK